MATKNCQAGQGGAAYTLHYNVEPNNTELYKDLKKADASEARVAEIVLYAKEIARSAGYPLSGRDLDAYTVNGSTHSVDVSVRENSGYYNVMLLPDVQESSHNLQVSIRKSDKKIIAILLGG